MPIAGRQDGVSSGRLEAGQVRSMFDRIASVYDPLNTAMTAGLHHRWRTRAADLACVGPGSRVLDVASGTGDLALELARRVAPDGEVVGSDFSEAMLDIARAKAVRRFGAGALAERRAPGHRDAGGNAPDDREADGHAPDDREADGHAPDDREADGHALDGAGAGQAPPVALRFEWADALQLPYPDESFDAATVGFGARNFSDLGRGLREMARVVRPGGRVVVLEFTTPTRPPLSIFYKVWFDRVVPLLGRITAPLVALLPKRGSRSDGEVTIAQAYTYLPSSVKRFLAPAELAAELERAGLTDIRYITTAGGIVVIHVATVPM